LAHFENPFLATWAFPVTHNASVFFRYGYVAIGSQLTKSLTVFQKLFTEVVESNGTPVLIVMDMASPPATRFQ
jgi:hypothetical protein